MLVNEQLQIEIDRWSSEPSVPRELKDAIKSMTEAELAECFAADISFGTGGMRGLMGPGPGRINVCTVRRAAWGFAVHLLEHCDNAKQRGVVIAYDNRHNSREFAVESAAVLFAQGIKTYVFSELMPTPVLSFAVRYLGAVGGIVVTASHNPPAYNGFKIYDENGCQMTPEHTDAVGEKINSIPGYFVRDMIAYDKCESMIADPQGVEHAYSDMIIDLMESFPEDILGSEDWISSDEIALEPLKVVYSAQHGTGWRIVPQTLMGAGFTVIEVTEQCHPDADFTFTKSPNPEDPVSFELAYTYAENNNADIILVTDPDADRVGVAVKCAGKFVRLSGNQIGAVLLDYILKRKAEKVTDAQAKPYVVTTIVTSDIGDAICSKYAVDLIKTLTGFKYIGETIQRKIVQNEKAEFLFGFEESYGYLFDPSVRDKDAVQACAMLSMVADDYRAEGKTLLDALDDIYAEHGFYYDHLESIAFKGISGMQQMESFMQNIRQQCKTIFAADNLAVVEDYEGRFAQILATGEQRNLDLPQAEVLKLIFADGSWLVFRPSGTEPKLKIYACIRAAAGVNATAESEKQYALLRSRLVASGLILS